LARTGATIAPKAEHVKDAVCSSQALEKTLRQRHGGIHVEQACGQSAGDSDNAATAGGLLAQNENGRVSLSPVSLQVGCATICAAMCSADSPTPSNCPDFIQGIHGIPIKYSPA
jgi:hypothetical protein